LRELYDLLSDPSFAILVVIVLAVASIIGLILIDQVPFRGEMARFRYPGRENEPGIWFLIHIVPASPFRTVLYRTLLALLASSLLACTLKRWRRASHLALTIGEAPESAFGPGPGGASSALVWVARAPRAAESIVAALKRSLFAVRLRQSGETTFVSGSRFGLARLGPILTHVGFLLLIIGALWLGAAGVSRQVWMSPGDTAPIPESSLSLALEDFRVETTPAGEISQYVSRVTLFDGDREVKRAEIQVNRPLRYRGHSFYQSSYRQDPNLVRSVSVVVDAAAGETGAPTLPGHGAGRHDAAPQDFAMPVSLRIPWGEWVAVPGTPYTVAIDTFFIDLRIDARGPTLASDEPRNPAVRLSFRRDGEPAGETWYFLFHPDMPVGSGPDLPLRVTDYTPLMATGLEVVTHPGAGWIWAGFAVVTLGTLLAFLLHHERVWLRLQPTGTGESVAWEIALIHQGAAPQAPEFVREPWEASVTPLAIRLLRVLAPDGGRPLRWPGGAASEEENA
jgi:cytochrome c biogenesis protein ResB